MFTGVIDVVPVDVTSHERIDAFAFSGHVADLEHALIEHERRHVVRDTALVELPLYPEDRIGTGSTAARVIEVFEPLSTHELVEKDQVLKRYDPSLSKLHRQILDLLTTSTTAYQAIPNAPRYFERCQVGPETDEEGHFRDPERP